MVEATLGARWTLGDPAADDPPRGDVAMDGAAGGIAESSGSTDFEFLSPRDSVLTLQLFSTFLDGHAARRVVPALAVGPTAFDPDLQVWFLAAVALFCLRCDAGLLRRAGVRNPLTRVLQCFLSVADSVVLSDAATKGNASGHHDTLTRIACLLTMGPVGEPAIGGTDTAAVAGLEAESVDPSENEGAQPNLENSAKTADAVRGDNESVVVLDKRINRARLVVNFNASVHNPDVFAAAAGQSPSPLQRALVLTVLAAARRALFPPDAEVAAGATQSHPGVARLAHALTQAVGGEGTGETQDAGRFELPLTSQSQQTVTAAHAELLKTCLRAASDLGVGISFAGEDSSQPDIPICPQVLVDVEAGGVAGQYMAQHAYATFWYYLGLLHLTKRSWRSAEHAFLTVFTTAGDAGFNASDGSEGLEAPEMAEDGEGFVLLSPNSRRAGSRRGEQEYSCRSVHGQALRKFILVQLYAEGEFDPRSPRMRRWFRDAPHADAALREIFAASSSADAVHFPCYLGKLVWLWQVFQSVGEVDSKADSPPAALLDSHTPASLHAGMQGIATHGGFI